MRDSKQMVSHKKCLHTKIEHDETCRMAKNEPFPLFFSLSLLHFHTQK